MADNPILSVASDVLALLPPSLMLRSTCHAFHDILELGPTPRKHQTVAADAVSSTSLIMWAVQTGMDAVMEQTSCIRRGDMPALLLLRRTQPTAFFFLPPEHAEIAAKGTSAAVAVASAFLPHSR
eukprot:TRINITY_DN7198_c1_g1_i1.p1 TRINITY_DN7198_c1_g1~~TRINITY_DN7198_c1_g1_i1.p1  ORF type:complete len:125 (+),score=14.99 TRINITY_DN7198_c1_g1_i1:32-406(+)